MGWKWKKIGCRGESWARSAASSLASPLFCASRVCVCDAVVIHIKFDLKRAGAILVIRRRTARFQLLDRFQKNHPKMQDFFFLKFFLKMSAEFRINRLIIPAIMICRCENVWRRHLMGAIVDLKKKFQIPSTDLVEAVINLSHLVPLFLGAAQSDQQIAQKKSKEADCKSIDFSASRGSSNSRHD